MSPDVASELAETVPRLAEDWRLSGGDLDLPTVASAFLAQRVSELDQVRPPIDWSPLFSEIERRLSSADADLREVLVTGFLEGLQNMDLNHNRDPKRWEPLLGPRTSAAWHALFDFWDGKGTWNSLMPRDIARR